MPFELSNMLDQHVGLLLIVKCLFREDDCSNATLDKLDLFGLQVDGVLHQRERDQLFQLGYGAFDEHLVLVRAVLVHDLNARQLVVFDHISVDELLVSQLLLVTVDRDHPLVLGSKPVAKGLRELQLGFLLLVQTLVIFSLLIDDLADLIVSGLGGGHRAVAEQDGFQQFVQLDSRHRGHLLGLL